MRQYQISYENKTDFICRLEDIKSSCAGLTGNKVTFYLTWTESALSGLDSVTESISKVFPESAYYGNEASGNIACGDFTLGINVTCYVFEEKDTEVELVWVEKGTAISSLEELWKYCRTKKNLKAVEMIPSMSYVDVLEIDTDVPDLSGDILIFGGSSVNYDNATYDADIIAKGHTRTKDGMAVMLYFGEKLSFYSSDILGWKGLGRLMEVTDSTGKCIREIDGTPAYSVYEKYLNLTVEDRDTLVFPLIVEEDGNEYIRTPQIVMPDKSMQMFANIPRGTKVRIAYGDKNTILAGIDGRTKEISAFGPDAIKAYSCAARRLFWGDSEVGKETKPLQEIAPVCGFYTGGEILRFGDKLRVLNSTLAIVCFREGDEKRQCALPATDQGEDKSLVSRLTFFAEKIVDEERTQRVLAESLERIIASEYQVMYYIDIIGGRSRFIHGDEDAKKFLPIFNASSAESIFDNFTKYYVDAAIVEEDRKRVKSVMNIENIYRVLKDSNSISVNYRVRRNMVDPVYTEMRIFKADEKDGLISSIIIAFKTSDEELRSALELTKKLQNEVLDEVLGDDAVFLIDCEADKRKTIHDNTHGADKYNDEEQYSTTFARYVDTCVAEADRGMMRKFLSPGYMMECLEDRKEYSIQYRDITTGIQRFYEMRIVRFSKSEVLQSFTEKDKEIVDGLIFNRLEDDYFAMYGVDLDAGLLRSMKESKWFDTGGEGSVSPYTPHMKAFSEMFEGEPKRFFDTISDISYLKRRFAKEDKATYIYKSPIANSTKWVNVTELVLTRHDDGTPSIMAIGFSFLDEDSSRLQEIQAKLKENARIIGALSEDFGCVNYVELTENKFNDISVGIRTSELLLKLIPEWNEELTFSKKLDLLINNLVYEPDRAQFFNDTRREKILDELKKDDTYYINVRFLIEGEVRYYQIQIASIRDKDELVGFVAGIRSIDDQMKKEIETQKQLQDALSNAEVANNSKSAFLFNMSHDIRTPMNAIKGFTAMAKKYIGDSEKVMDYLDKIDISGQQLLTLINQVLEMSRIESGKIEFIEAPVNIKERFESMITVISAQARSKGLDFHYALEDVTHFNVLADDSRMGQITLNIVGNAIKYTPEGGRIDFVLKEIPSRKEGCATYTFTVKDTGIGMSEDYLKRIYEPFSREQSSTVSKIQGTGLGMSIVKNLVDLLGGDIKVLSEVGKGTRFDVTIDLRTDEKALEEPDKNEIVNVFSFEGRRVLLVEDNEMNREIAKDILEEYGFLVDEAEDGDIAVEKCLDIAGRGDYNYYDFILMDIQMPRMNGYEATKAIRAIPSPENIHVPIIAMTANAFDEDRQNALDSGMDEHLSKPIEIKMLLETLSKFMC